MRNWGRSARFLGRITFGDTAQTGNITFTTATPATTSGAQIYAVQSTAGGGGIVLDDDFGGGTAGTALAGGSSLINLTAGTGGITAKNANNTLAEIATTGATVTLNTTGTIGTNANRIQFADQTNTAQQRVVIGTTNQPSNVSLDGLGTLTIGGITGNTANTVVDVTARTGLNVDGTITTGTGTISLGADLNYDGTADSGAGAGTGTLTLLTGSSVTSANTTTSAITLRGADIDINGTGSVSATGAGGGVVVRTSQSALAMSIGGTNTAVTGVNLTDAELGQISTLASGRITFGDTAQTGNITFTTATPATTSGAQIYAVQSTAGGGGIVLDDDFGGGTAGTALAGGSSLINLTAGTGGITAKNANNTLAEIATTGATVTLNTTGTIGTNANRIQFADQTNTAQQRVVIGTTNQPSNVSLDGLGTLTIGGITGDAANTVVDVTARTGLNVDGTITTGTGTISLGADLNYDGTADSGAGAGTGTLTLLTGSSVTSANTTTSAITLRGADIDINGSWQREVPREQAAGWWYVLRSRLWPIEYWTGRTLR